MSDLSLLAHHALPVAAEAFAAVAAIGAIGCVGALIGLIAVGVASVGGHKVRAN